MSRSHIVASADRPRPLSVVGEHITVLADRNVTQGYEIFLQQGAEGTGPPAHLHDWDEAFYVLQGEVDFGVEDERLTAQQGTLVHIAKGTPHWFRFGRGGAQMLSITGQGSDAAAFFTQIDADLPTGAMTADLLAPIANKHAVHFQ